MCRLTILGHSLLGRGMLELGLLQRHGGGRVLRLLDGGAGRVVLLVAHEQTHGEGLLVGRPGLIRQLRAKVTCTVQGDSGGRIPRFVDLDLGGVPPAGGLLL